VSQTSITKGTKKVKVEQNNNLLFPSTFSSCPSNRFSPLNSSLPNSADLAYNIGHPSADRMALESFFRFSKMDVSTEISRSYADVVKSSVPSHQNVVNASETTRLPFIHYRVLQIRAKNACFRCAMTRHIESKCWNTILCYRCGHFGHTSNKCIFSYQGRYAATWKPKQNAAVSSSPSHHSSTHLTEDSFYKREHFHQHNLIPSSKTFSTSTMAASSRYSQAKLHIIFIVVSRIWKIEVLR